MTDYAIRINIQTQEHYEKIKQYYTENFNIYLISPIEIGTKTNKEHIHTYIKIIKKKDALIKQLKRADIIQTGNSSYSCVQITQKSYNSIEEAINMYLSYCLKTKTNVNIPSYKNIDIQQLPIWETKHKYLTNKRFTFKQKLILTYEPINSKKMKDIQIHIITHILNLFKEEKKMFSTQMIKTYTNGLLMQYYSDLISIEQLYYDINKDNHQII